MPEKKLLQSDVNALNKSVNSEKTARRLAIFFKMSPSLKRLRLYAENQRIRFGLVKSKITENRTIKLEFFSLLIRPECGTPKEKIILIPEYFTWLVFLNRHLEQAIFALAHEIGHMETLLEIEIKRCKAEKESCLYLEQLANNRAWEILKKNRIIMKKEVFSKCVSDAINIVPDHSVCSKRLENGLCPYKPLNRRKK